jgi:hypothetical protein
MSEVLEELQRRNGEAEAGGGAERVKQRHERGLLTAANASTSSSIRAASSRSTS